jgi:hypothetical protein
MKGSHWNRSGRRSGGAKRPRIVIVREDVRQSERPQLSIQCFERRHLDCFRKCEPFSPSVCQCPCHEER